MRFTWRAFSSAIAAKSESASSSFRSRGSNPSGPMQLISSITPKQVSRNFTGTATIDCVSVFVFSSTCEKNRVSFEVSGTTTVSPCAATQPAIPCPIFTRTSFNAVEAVPTASSKYNSCFASSSSSSDQLSGRRNSSIMEKIDEFLRPDNWSLLLLDEAKQELYFELAVGTASTALKDVRVKMGQGIAGWVAAHGETVVVPDTSKDTRFFSQVDEKTNTETQSIVAVPVKFRDTCLGVIELINCIGPEGFDPRDLKLLEALSDFAAIALENARHVKRIHELTITDDCTTLYNARHMSFILETEIYRSQRYAYEFSLIFIDLDHFKQVNDTQGHLVGSRLLADIGNALKQHCRLIDFAFRYGGDEFVLLLPQTSKENATNVARRLHRLIREATWLSEDGLNIKLTASMGVASYPVDSRTKEGLLHLADEAMYLAKNTNRDSVAVANIGILPHLPAATAESAG